MSAPNGANPPTADPILALIAQEDPCHPLSREDPLLQQILATHPTTIEGVAAKVEFLLVDPTDFVESILADLRALAAGGAA
jgi:hypothetical protein